MASSYSNAVITINEMLLDLNLFYGIFLEKRTSFRNTITYLRVFLITRVVWLIWIIIYLGWSLGYFKIGISSAIF